MEEIGRGSGALLIEGDGPNIYVDDLKAFVHTAEEGGYWAEVPSLPGCLTQGETLDEIVENIEDAIQGWLSVQTRESLIAQGIIPSREPAETITTLDAPRRKSRIRTLEFEYAA